LGATASPDGRDARAGEVHRIGSPGLGFGQGLTYISGMLRMRKKPPAPSLQRRRQLEITVLAHNQALHYLASHPLTADELAQLTEVVLGYTGPCDVGAAREGLAWLRERYRERGERAPF
jgi:hypothetical protein